jgi:alpha-glucosidase
MRLLFFALFLSPTLFAQIPIQKLAENHYQIGGGSYPVLELKEEMILIQTKKQKVKEKFGFYRFKEKIKGRCSKLKLEQQTDKDFLGSYEDCDCTFKLSLTQLDRSAFQLDLQLEGEDYNFIQLNIPHRNADFYGGGIQYSHFKLNGERFQMLSQESGIGRGDQPISRWTKLMKIRGSQSHTHLPIPFVIQKEKDKHQSYWLKGYARAHLDFQTDRLFKISTDGQELSLEIRKSQSLPQLLKSFTAASGRLPQLPKWAYQGTWLGTQGGLTTVKKQVQQAKAAGNPITALWIQDWVGKRKTRVGWQLNWQWKADKKSYPNFKDFCKEMNAEGLKVLGYINPFLADEGVMTEEAISKGYLIKDHKGKPYKIPTAGFPAYMIDLTNPEAANWLKTIIKENMIEAGLSGWMSDYAEGLPWDAVLHSGISAAEYHNQYPVDFARLNREAIQEAGKEGEIVFFSRSGHNHSARYATTFWMADQMVDWGRHDGLPSTVTAALSAGLSGISQLHSDIGGYTTITYALMPKVKRSKELLYRWTEFNVFHPIFRTHEGLKPAKNAQVYDDTETVEHFAKMGQLHEALAPYFEHLLQEAEEKGYPLLRPVFWVDPTYEKAFDPLQPLLCLGNELLIAPLVQEGLMEVLVELPSGSWWHPWSKQSFEGNAKVKVPFGQPAFFVREGTAWTRLLKEALD